MKKSQFEELTLSFSIIIALLAYKFEINWLFSIYFIKSIFDFLCVIHYSLKEAKEEFTNKIK